MSMIPERMYDGSYVYGVVSQSERLQNRLRTSYDRSALGRGVETLGSITRHSFLFRWLTAEPDPDVIVIDLRETVTVGPLLAVLDSVLSVLTDAWSSSRFRTVTTAIERHLRTRPVRIGSFVLFLALAMTTLVSLATATLTTLEFGIRFGLLTVFAVGTRITHSWRDITESRIYRLLLTIIEPPEMPEDDSGDGDPGPK
ncbi:hypothetical protein ACFQJ5_01410 [Halomicroarcula sp. GCM10025324]|uniref:hypothetical protein n=1 Tax=Haloarcula TaxID=2237 RepID=UPI0023E7D699|nr:hypothetical protein [Halomicroarcula sp. ZS-22-S1]